MTEEGFTGLIPVDIILVAIALSLGFIAGYLRLIATALSGGGNADNEGSNDNTDDD